LKKEPKLTPCAWDALVAAAVLALALLLGARFWFLPSADGAREAVVSVGGVELERVPLADAERVYESNGYTLHVVFSPEGVYVASSDCPTQDCVHTGTITRAGQSIVCLPARLVVTLTGASEGYDAIAG